MLHITTMDTSVKVPPLGHWQMLLGGRTEHEDQRKFLLSNRITPHITTMDTSVKVHPLGHWQMLLGGRTEHEDQRKCLLSNRITPHTTTKGTSVKVTPLGHRLNGKRYLVAEPDMITIGGFHLPT
ncbi:hypothetical protein B9Z55_023317 [Caenorhabditis nigoni]|uniref:Uncharacterized protein n=1 Tax=Caenorhabditis nigoni TaxID=1611254 RepID=A0A2G5SPE5_9PELO|nr:hypothetical protein B9Z55_023317 [Caenorhabditis nigoni]